MNTFTVDDAWLTVDLPEGFGPLPQDELEAFMGLSYECMWGARDPERHMMVAVTWKDSNDIITKLVSEKSLAKRVDKAYAARRRAYGYHNDGFFTREIPGASARAHGFGYSSTPNGTPQKGEVLVFKRGSRCYTLIFQTTTQTRAETAETDRSIHEGIIASLRVGR